MTLLLAGSLLFFLAFANGANDVSKAVATLAGAKLASVHGVVLWGTTWTVAGALTGLIWGAAIIHTVLHSIYSEQHVFYLPVSLAIALAPSLWVVLSTWRKWPVSTTHAIVGGLIGAGIAAYGIDGIAWRTTFYKLGLPLLLSPFAAISLAYVLTPVLERAALLVSRVKVCVSPLPKLVFAGFADHWSEVSADDCVVCDADSIAAHTTPGFVLSVDQLHWLTSGMLSFSRGLNDAPKLIAIVMPFMLLADNAPPEWSYVLAAFAMGAGGMLVGRRVTEVLGFEITKMSSAQGFSANLVATFLVLGASPLGMPVSTTHVSASAIMGIGLSNGFGLNRETVKSMLFAWLVTVPLSGLFGALIYYAVR